MPERRPPWGLERRLRRSLLWLLFVCWLAASALMLAGMWRDTRQVLDSALAETAERLLSLPDAAFQDTTVVAVQEAADPPREFVIYQVFDAAGRLRLRSHSAPGAALIGATTDGLHEVGDWRVFALSRPDGSRRALVADTLSHRRELLWSSLGWIVAALASVTLLAAGALRLVLARAFRSLDAARAELASRQDDDLRPLADAAAPLEVEPWLHTVNGLMARVRTMLDAERAFAAQAAHELRTPLAAARAQGQRLALTATSDETRRHAEALVRQLDRLTALTARLLQLARIESGVALKREAVDLAQLASLVADEHAAERRSGALVVAVADGVHLVEGDIDALAIALRNLIANALRHGRPPVRIEVEARSIGVADDGPGVAPDQLAILVRPFVRGEAASTEGAGLGLAIVERIARQSGATLELRSASTGPRRGLVATIRFAEPS